MLIIIVGDLMVDAFKLCNSSRKKQLETLDTVTGALSRLAKWFEFMELLLGKICPTRAVPR